MKIVFATDQYWPCISGVSVSVDAFRVALMQLGHQVILLAPQYPQSSALDDQRQVAHLHRFASMAAPFNDENRLVRFSEKARIEALLVDIDPDIIHVHTEFTLGRMVSHFARDRKIPLVMTAHTNWEELIDLYIPWIPKVLSRLFCRFRMRSCYRIADTLVLPTTLMEKYIERLSLRGPSVIIPTGIDPDDFAATPEQMSVLKADIIQKFPELSGKRILFFAGRLGLEKNIPFLFQMLKLVLLEQPETMLVIAGDGPARSELEQRVLQQGLSSHVVFTGFVERSVIKGLYSLSDIFVFASKVESQGMVALEAMTCGTPVVAIGKMGTLEIMHGDNGGFMVEDDIHEFASRVLLLLSDPRVYALKCADALKHAQNWYMRAQGAKMHHLYQSLVSQEDSVVERDTFHGATAT